MGKRRLRRSSGARATAPLIAIAGWLASGGLGAAARAQSDADDAPPVAAAPLTIEITGHEFQWKVRYPGPDGQLGTADDFHDSRHVRVPVGRDVELILHSRDYLYTLALPHAQLKEIAVPDLTFSLKLRTDRVGSFELRGDQFCGYSHPQLIGEFVVMTEPEFESWARQGAPQAADAQ